MLSYYFGNSAEDIELANPRTDQVPSVLADILEMPFQRAAAILRLCLMTSECTGHGQHQGNEILNAHNSSLIFMLFDSSIEATILGHRSRVSLLVGTSGHGHLSGTFWQVVGATQA